jgi:type I restriction enzyme M protein
MALKKSELYSSLWQSCDELRGGMDASQYKDYVLAMLFIKYVSDKYAGLPYAPIKIPEGASFNDMVALKGKIDIGDKINSKIIDPLAKANNLEKLADFNDKVKLGDGKEMVDRLTNLIAIFENPALDFSKNRAEGDDILGDAYEYLMRHFATQSGKNKGYFYIPSEISLIISHVLAIKDAQTTNSTTICDPICGCGSLLLKVASQAKASITIYGQEKDTTNATLAKMNMIMHDNPIAIIEQGNALSEPKFKNGNELLEFDYVVAGVPFSDKRWNNGVNVDNDPFGRFDVFGAPPAKQGDYAYLLHIIRSLKSTGRGACILPHGVLFRGNAEADIRRKLIRKGYIQGIIGLPANLFYGTGIPACIIVIDKNDAPIRKGVFMIDASAGFLKDGNKNRLRAMDIHKIVDVWTKQIELPKFSRMVSFDEIEKNEFNLNLPRYIDSQQAEDLQDIEAHLKGGIPASDVDALQEYWQICPQLQKTLFNEIRPNYVALSVEKSAIKSAIYEHHEFVAFTNRINAVFAEWETNSSQLLKALEIGCHPRLVIETLSEDLLARYENQPLIDKYDVYQHLMDYWDSTMQDDVYLISADGWKAETSRILEKNKDKGWTCDLIPKNLVIARYFAKEQQAINDLEADIENLTAQETELEEEHGGEEGLFSELDKISKASVSARLKEIKGDKEAKDEIEALNTWLKIYNEQAEAKRRLKTAESELDAKVYEKYPTLSESEIKTLVVNDKWLATLEAAFHGEMNRISQALTQRIKQLAQRYETPVSLHVQNVADLEAKVNQHLAKMGFSL